MPIRVQCKCGKVLKIPETHAGKKAKCPGCGIIFRVPEPKPKPEAAPEPQPQVQPDLEVGLEFETEVKPQSKPQPRPEPKPPSQPEAAFELETPVTELGAVVGAHDLDMEWGGGSTEEEAATPQPPAAPQPPPQSDAPIELDRSAEESAAATGEGIACPKCGKQLDADHVICMECGINVKTGLPVGQKAGGAFVARLKGTLAKLKQVVAAKKKVLVIAGAVVVLAGAGVAGAFYFLGKKKPVSGAPAVGQPAPPPPPSGAQAPAAPTPTPTPAPTGAPAFVWQGFADPAAETGRRMWLLRQALLAWRVKHNAFPGCLAEMVPEVLSEQAAARLVVPDYSTPDVAALGECYSYAGPEVAALPRLHILLSASKAGPGGKVIALFGDGVTRALTPADVAAFSLKKRTVSVGGNTVDLWLTPAEENLLDSFKPTVRVRNDRLAHVDVAIDDLVLGSVKFGGEALFKVKAGNHTVVLSAGKSATLKVHAGGALITDVRLARCQDMVVVPIRQYEVAMSRRPSPYKDIKQFERRSDGNRLVALVAQDGETVREVPGKGLTIDAEKMTINGSIIRGGILIEGANGNPIRVGEAQRLEDGLVVFGNKRSVRYWGTDLGAVTVLLEPNLALADRVFLKSSPAVQRRGAEDMPPGYGPERGQPGEMEGRGRFVLDESLTFDDAATAERLDCDLLAPALREVGRGSLGALWNYVAQPTAGETPVATPAPGPGPAGPPYMRPEEQAAARLPATPEEWLAQQTDRGPEMRPMGTAAPSDAERALAVIGLLSRPEDMIPLTTMAQTGSLADARTALAVEGLGRIGSQLALPTLARFKEGQAAPVELVALAMIEADAARKALRDRLATAPVDTIVETMLRWPDAAGYAARCAFVTALGEAKAAAFEDRGFVTTVLRFEPGSAIAVARKLLKAEAAVGTTPAEPRPPAGMPPDMERPAQNRLPGLAMATMLVRQHVPEAIEDLVKQAAEAKGTARLTAVAALATAHDDGMAPLYAPLLKADDAQVRRQAVDALVESGSRRALGVLGDGMSATIALPVVLAAAPQLVKSAGGEATAQLFVKLWAVSKGQPSRGVAPAAAKPAAEAGAPADGGAAAAPVPPPEEGRPGGGATAATKAEQVTVFPEDVIAAIGRLGVRNAETTAAVDEALAAKEDAVRCAAVVALARLHSGSDEDKKTVRGRLDALLKDGDAQVRGGAIEGLAIVGGQQAVATLQPLLKDKDPVVRAAVVRGLGAIGGAGAIALVRSALQDVNETADVVLAGVGVAAERREKALAAPLGVVLARSSTGGFAERNAEVKKSAVEALGEIGDWSAIKMLEVLPTAEGESLAPVMITALSRIGDARACQKLIEYTKSDKADIRGAAIEALLAMDSAPAANALAQVAFPTSGGLTPAADRALDAVLRSKHVAVADALAARVNVSKGETAYVRVYTHARTAGKEINDALYARYLLDVLKGNQEAPMLWAATELGKRGIRDEPLTVLSEKAQRDPLHGAAPLAALLECVGQPKDVELLSTVYEEVKRKAVQGRRDARVDLLLAIGKIGGEDATTAIRRLMSREPSRGEAALWSASVTALGRVQDAKAAERLVVLAGVRSEYRAEAIESLTRNGHLAFAEVEPALTRAVQDIDPVLAGTGADALDVIRARMAQKP